MVPPIEPGRALPWAVLLGWTTVALLPTVGAVAGGASDLTVPVVLGVAVLGATSASALDDPAEAITAAVPASRPRRRLARVARAAAMCSVATAVLLGMAGEAAGVVSVGGAHLAAVGLAAGMAALALVSRLPLDPQAPRSGLGGTAGGLLAVLVCAAMAQRVRWLPTLGVEDHTGRWWAVAAVSAVVAAPVLRDPGRQRVRAQEPGRRCSATVSRSSAGPR